MNTFIEIPACNHSLNARTFIFNVGINDAPYKVTMSINNKKVLCPFYVVWYEMLRRSYSPYYHKKQPTYAICTVHKDWHSFMTFKSWMMKQDYANKQLDKDLLIVNNKEYAPNKCVFVPQAINVLLNTKPKGNLPEGVAISTKHRFKAHICKKGKKVYLGSFSTAEEAGNKYKQAKAKHIKEIADTQPANIKAALYRRAALL